MVFILPGFFFSPSVWVFFCVSRFNKSTPSDFTEGKMINALRTDLSWNRKSIESRSLMTKKVYSLKTKKVYQHRNSASLSQFWQNN